MEHNRLAPLNVPYSDFRAKTVVYSKEKFQTLWSEQVHNKLFQLKPDVYSNFPSVVSNRKEQTLLHRLHVGHTHATHGFILRRENRPWCHGCDLQFSIRHIFYECWDLFQIRERYFGTRDMKAIFWEVQSHVIFAFLKEINMYYKL